MEIPVMAAKMVFAAMVPRQPALYPAEHGIGDFKRIAPHSAFGDNKPH